jgi:hypothetical protein
MSAPWDFATSICVDEVCTAHGSGRWGASWAKWLGFREQGLWRKPRHDLRYTRAHLSRPYPEYLNSNNTNCSVELN